MNEYKPDRAHVSTYGGELTVGGFKTVQHWQLWYKGYCFGDTSISAHVDLFEEVAEKLNSELNVVHMRDRQKGHLPLCWPNNTGEVFKSASDVDKVDCVGCLRMLAKSAVQFGNGRKARRS